MIGRKKRPTKDGLYDPANEHDNCGIGFVAHLRGEQSHDIVARGLQVLERMNHRGALGADALTGDGSGMMLQVPHKLLNKAGFHTGKQGSYGLGMLFLPQNTKEANHCIDIVSKYIKEEGLQLEEIGDIATDNSHIGKIARNAEPCSKRLLIKGKGLEQETLEQKLYLVRKQSENEIRNSKLKEKELFYFSSLSSKVAIYKGMLTPDQLAAYYPDLRDKDLESAIALVHSRFSTNTFPSWDLAQPFRMIAHNGEINTVKGNRAWFHAREGILQSSIYGQDLPKLFPVIEPNKSDSASFDNALEFLHHTGRSLPHALCMMVPESYNEKNPIPESTKAFYEYHSTMMEPWDGPASLVFSDGRYIGGTLDRNGLRPSRYIITKQGLIVMGSEVGVQTFAPEEIEAKGRLRPGKILLIDTQLGTIIPDDEVKRDLTQKHPYLNWLKENRINLKEVPAPPKKVPALEGKQLDLVKRAFSFTREDIEVTLLPMGKSGQEPTNSMGADTSQAAFSEKPYLLFNYFKQMFAQVTNPPIDPIREELVMSLSSFTGATNKNVLEDSEDHCKLIRFENPVLTDESLLKIKNLTHESFVHQEIPILYEHAQGGKGLKKALQNICEQAAKAVDENKNYVILSDRGIDKKWAAIPSLLAVSAVHHHLIRLQVRTKLGIIVESAEPREVHHFALLFGYGASMVNPYASFAILKEYTKKEMLPLTYPEAVKNYMNGLKKGLLKIMSKMGISTLSSYHGSQIFEAIGLSSKVIDEYFSNTVSRVEGIGLDEIAKESYLCHEQAFPDKSKLPDEDLNAESGFIHYRNTGEQHGWDPQSIALLQWATRSNSYEKYKEYAAHANQQTRKPIFLRGYFDLKKAKKPIPIDEVEPAENLVRRFCTGAMSYGSISKEAHEALASALNRVGGRSNTGEGGEDEERLLSKKWRSSIKQVASGRFGVTPTYLIHADELQIKIAQGAKPGEGGQLPGFKVDKIIANLRNSTPGITLISPPPHHDIYSIEDLAQLIHDLKCVNPRAKVSVKLVAENGVGTIAAGVTKAHADLITLSGMEGGTGASPLSSIKHAGLPSELGIAETHQVLVKNNLRGWVKLQSDGQLKTGRDIVSMALLGAEEFGFATSALIVLGCVMMRKCHLNTCPTGVATQKKELRERFIGRADWLVNFFNFLAQDVREIMAELGTKTFDELVGRADLIVPRKDINGWKAKCISINNLIHQPKESKTNALFNELPPQKVTNILDDQLIEKSEKALSSKEPIWFTREIKNTDRSVGARLSGEICYRHGSNGLPEDTINVAFHGSAGQSFGAFLAPGVSFRLEGDANDYLGKGLAGGKIIAVPPLNSTFVPEENIIAGNTLLYGATGGEAYLRGIVGERFAVRNSGATAVIEGAGDHCCEYMTGGRVVVLGKTGRNFAAGMSGGIAYVLDNDGDFDYYCNQGLVGLEKVEEKEDLKEIQSLIHKHGLYTNSLLAREVLSNWERYVPQFVKVIPFEYKKILEEEKLIALQEKLKQTEAETVHQE